MKSCTQTKNQSILDHGFSVKNHLFDLISHLEKGTPLKYEWKLPNWVYDNKDLLLSSLPSKQTLKLYTVFHDIGKPFCQEIDSDGKSHFPNHSEVSQQVFDKYFNDTIASSLIKHDMDIHLLKSDDIESFCKNPFALTLLLTGLSELHSNAKLFGGTDSVSFKIKWKHINKRGNQILTKIKSKNVV